MKREEFKDDGMNLIRMPFDEIPREVLPRLVFTGIGGVEFACFGLYYAFTGQWAHCLFDMSLAMFQAALFCFFIYKEELKIYERYQEAEK